MNAPASCLVALKHSWEEVVPTEETCPGLTRALAAPGYVPTIVREDQKWYFLGEERLVEPFTYCPWCGRKLVLRE